MAAEQPKRRRRRKAADGEPSTTGRKGSLVVVGTGIRTAGQITTEAVAWIGQADAVLYVVGDPVAEAAIHALNPHGAVSLAGYYEEGQSRMFAYHAMVEHILGCVRSGRLTVAAFYGHPGVFAYPSHESIRRARAEGYPARMLPGVSAEDCLFADLGVDPAVGGCQSFEATDFLLNSIQTDPSTQLVLWQIGTLCDWTYKTRMYDIRAMPLLVQKLMRTYPGDHPVTVYEAAMFPGADPMIATFPLYWLDQFPITAAMTLYVPPARPRVPDLAMAGLFAMNAPYAPDPAGQAPPATTPDSSGRSEDDAAPAESPG